jgi:hypothetical protein
MHLLAESTAEIACPVNVAYQYAANLEHFGEWFPGVIAIESANGLSHGEPGKEYLETVAVPLRGQRKIKLVVKEAEHDISLVTEGAFPPLLPRMQIRFKALTTESCQVQWQMFSRNKGLLAQFTIIPLARGVMRNRAAVGLAALKSRLEAK